MQRHILVTGANGFVGRALCGELQNKGFYVRGVVRQVTNTGYSAGFLESSVAAEAKNRETITVGDIGYQTDWKSVLADIDTVIHLASRVHVMREAADDPEDEYYRVNVAGTERLAAMAADAGVRRFIYVSSIKVNGERTVDAPFTENDAPHPEDAYGRSKLQAERALYCAASFSKLEIVVVRPPLIYGPGVKGNFLRLMGVVDQGWVLPLASVDNRRSLVGLGNLVDLLIRCVEHPDAAGETFLVADEEDLSTPELIRRIARVMGRRANIFPFPEIALRAASRLLGKAKWYDRLCGSLTVDTSKARRLLMWCPPFSVDAGLAQAVQWYVADRGVRSE